MYILGGRHKYAQSYLSSHSHHISITFPSHSQHQHHILASSSHVAVPILVSYLRRNTDNSFKKSQDACVCLFHPCLSHAYLFHPFRSPDVNKISFV